MQRPETYAIIPAFNEATAIAAVVADVRPYVDVVIVVDDGSRDETAAAAREAGAIVLRHALNRGQGAALATGVRYALRRGAQWIVTFDADGQHQARDIPALLAPVRAGECDIALGSRFIGGGSLIPPLRRVLLKGAVVVTHLTSGLALTDAHNGLRALSRHAAETIRVRQDRMAHASEIIAEIKRHHLRAIEVPVTIRYTDYSRAKGQSALSAFRILIDLWLGRGVK